MGPPWAQPGVSGEKAQAQNRASVAVKMKKLAWIAGALLIFSTGCVQDQFRLTGGWSGVSGSDAAFYVATRDGRVVGIDGPSKDILYSRGGDPLTYPPIGEDTIGPIYATPHYDGDRVSRIYFEPEH